MSERFPSVVSPDPDRSACALESAASTDGSVRAGCGVATGRVVDDWLRDYQQFWVKSLQSLKRYVEEHR